MKKSIFYGNGLNYLSHKAIAWDELLNKLMLDNKFETSFLPNIMTYERIRLNWLSSVDKLPELKSEIAKLLKDQPANDFYKKILKMSFSDYITPNYDYALNKSFIELAPDNLEVSNSTENLYSLRRNTDLKSANGDVVGKVWNIHGELKHPKSIMLGLNHYCGSVGKIDRYLKGKYDFSYKTPHDKIIPIDEKIKLGSFDGYSWVELFFSSDVHIAGFGLDFSEIDIWWVLTKRARIKNEVNVKNRIKYYAKPLTEVTREIEVETRRREMLTTLDVDIIEVPFNGKDYEKHWDEILKRIEGS